MPPRDPVSEPKPLSRDEIEGVIASALAQFGQSPELEARVRALVAHNQGEIVNDTSVVTTLVERLTKDFVRIDEIRPDAMRRARPGMRP